MTTLNLQVSASSDDARQDGVTMDITNTAIRINSTVRRGGWRFTNVTIPQGATINTCTMDVFVDSTLRDDPDVIMYLQDADDTSTFTTTNNDITDRPITSGVAWNATGVGFGFTTTPSLVTPLQEVIDRGGWVSGNSIASLWYGQSTQDLNIRAYDVNPSFAGKIDIDYTAISSVTESEAVTVTDTPQATTDELVIPISESATLSESVTLQLAISPDAVISVSDAIGVIDSDLAELASLLSVSDTVSLSDIPQFDTKSLSVVDEVSIVDSPSFGNKFYVDNLTGSDANSGAIDAPWETIRGNIDTLSPGDTMFIRGGDSADSRQVYTESDEISPTVSGTASLPITIRNFPGEYIQINSPGNGPDVFNFASGTDYWTVSGSSHDYHILIDRENDIRRVIDILGDGITIEYVEMKQTAFDQAIRMSGTAGSTVRGCKIYDGFDGAFSGVNGVQVQNNCSDFTIEFCEIFDFSGDCIQVGGGPTLSPSETGGIIRYNTMYIGGGFLAPACGENAIDMKIVKDIQVYGNIMFGFRDNTGACGGTGSNGEAVVFQNQSDGMDFYDNITYDCSGGVIRCERGDVRLWGNLAYGMAAEAAASEVMWHFRNSHTFEFYNNTTIGQFGATTGDLFRFAGTPTITIKNNIFNDTGDLTDLGAATVTADYNCWSDGSTQHWVGANDITPVGEPDFVNSAADDYRIEDTSPCIDAADSAVWVSANGFWGAEPDMGYYEWIPIEEITTSENPLIDLVSLVAQSDSIALSESAQVVLAAMGMAINEPVGVSEFVQFPQFERTISVSDAVSLAENLAFSFLNILAVSDSAGVSESLTVVTDELAASLAENISISESVTPAKAIEVDVSANDAITLADSLAAETDTLSIGASETTLVTENVIVQQIIANVRQVTVSEAIGLSDVSEVDAGEPTLITQDTITLADSNTLVVIPADIAISEAETVTVADTPIIETGFLDVMVISQESITVADTSFMAMGILEINASDTVVVTENAIASILVGTIVLIATYKRTR